MSKSRLKGTARVRRLLRRLPDAARIEVVEALSAMGRSLLAAMRVAAKRRTGQLAGALSMRVYPRTMRVRVGLIGKRVNRALFYGRILNFGRKAQTVTAKRWSKGRKLTAYQMRVGALRGDRFVTERRGDLRKVEQARLRAIWGKVLARASVGDGGGD